MAQSKTNIGINKRAKPVADAVVARSGLNQEECTARLYEWFNELPDDVQDLALGQTPESLAPALATLLLQHMAGYDRPDVAGQIKPARSPGVSRRKRAAKKRGQDESRGGKS